MSRWYIIHAYSGFENKVRDAIMSEATRLGLRRLVEAVEVPTETVTEVKRGKKVRSSASSCPATCSPSCSMTDDVYHLVKNTPKVTGFLGSSGKPQPISDARPRAFRHQGRSRRGRAQAQDQRRLRDRRQCQGARRAVRQLQRHRRGARFRQEPGQGQRLDLRPRDPGGARFRAGRTGRSRVSVIPALRRALYGRSAFRAPACAWKSRFRAPLRRCRETSREAASSDRSV